ncbi:MAG: hypothetical protein K2X81_20660 [Candidatus Obscuribacterales bacterium]|nr:hypothetical protein [Candidatus Obscuribacterales bacterium]MBX9723831.1 hypothetical protein [Candidatus Obscuribacterales bacterium]
MPKPSPEDELKAIEDVLKAHPGGVSRQFIAEALPKDVPRRTLQARLRRLCAFPVNLLLFEKQVDVSIYEWSYLFK